MPYDSRRPPAQELLGRTLGGRYTVDAQIGTGGMGTVYRGTHQVLGSAVAIKVLWPHMALDADTVSRFLREARAATLLRHPNALIVHDFGYDDGLAYMVMELLGGVALSRMLKGALLPVARIARILGQAADAIAAAHAVGMVHRDVKPENIMVENRPTETDFVKVVDFGLARRVHSEGEGDLAGAITRTNLVLGTPQYMAPEQCRGGEVGAPADVYALGIVLYEMLAGRAPFGGGIFECISGHIALPPPPIVRPEGAEPVPQAWMDLVAGALEKDANLRPQTAADFRAWLLRPLGPAKDPSMPPPSGGREARYVVPKDLARTAPAGRVLVLGDANGALALLRGEGILSGSVLDERQAVGTDCVVLVADVGADVNRALQAVETLRSAACLVPVLVVTTATRIEAGRALVAGGAADVLVPPLSGPVLAKRVVRLGRRAR